MNSDFNFARFKMVVANDWKKFLSQYGVSLLVLLLIPVANWNSMIFFEDSLGCGTRLFLLSVLYILAIIMAPARMYSDVNQPKRGIYFAMLPASKLEKFLSMVLYCFIVTPLAFLIGSFAIDTLLGPAFRAEFRKLPVGHIRRLRLRHIPCCHDKCFQRCHILLHQHPIPPQEGDTHHIVRDWTNFFHHHYGEHILRDNRFRHKLRFRCH